jgi:hypothetical protein
VACWLGAEGTCTARRSVRTLVAVPIIRALSNLSLPSRPQMVSFVAWAYMGVSAFVCVPEECIDRAFVFAAPLEWMLEWFHTPLVYQDNSG